MINHNNEPCISDALDLLISTLGYIPHTFENISEALKPDGRHAVDCLRCRIDCFIANHKQEVRP